VTTPSWHIQGVVQVRNSGQCDPFSIGSPFPFFFPFLPFSSPPPAQCPEVSFPSGVRGFPRTKVMQRYFCDILSPGNVSCDN